MYPNKIEIKDKTETTILLSGFVPVDKEGRLHSISLFVN